MRRAVALALIAVGAGGCGGGSERRQPERRTIDEFGNDPIHSITLADRPIP